MRQVPIEQFKRNMGKEIKDLPFEVIRRGKHLFYVTNHMVQSETAIIETHGSELNHMVESIKPAKMPMGVVNNAEEAAEKLTEIIEKKQSTDNSETDIATDGRPVFGYPKSYQARKKGK